MKYFVGQRNSIWVSSNFLDEMRLPVFRICVTSYQSGIVNRVSKFEIKSLLANVATLVIL